MASFKKFSITSKFDESRYRVYETLVLLPLIWDPKNRSTESNFMQKPWLPQEIRDSDFSGSCRGPEVMKQRPLAAQSIGFVMTAWSSVEHHLCEMLAYLIDAEEWTAAEMYQEIWKIRVRVRLLIEFIRRKHGQVAAADARAVLHPLLEMSDQRDRLAHGYFIVPNTDDGIILVEGWGTRRKYLFYSQTTLDALVTEIHRRAGLVMRLGWMVSDLSPPRYEAGRWFPLIPLRQTWDHITWNGYFENSVPLAPSHIRYKAEEMKSFRNSLNLSEIRKHLIWLIRSRISQ
jgi:hypothetical protein